MLLVRFIVMTIVSTMFISYTADAQGFLKRFGLKKESALGNDTVSKGLKEALTKGIERAVNSTGKTDGFFSNEHIKIPIPKALLRIEGPLRSAGYGPQIDDFVLSMNRAAEAATPLAKEIFIATITSMTLKDAEAILKGNDTAATDYLNKHTRKNLTESFAPQITKTMNEFEVARKYKAVMGKYSSLPFGQKKLEKKVEEYTTEKSLDGLFYVLGQEEKRIRTEPAARTTELLRKIFE